MKYFFMMTICICLLLLCMPIQTLAKPGVSAENAVLIEQSSGRVLYEKAAHEPHLIASITKIMTALLAVESGKMDEMVTASHRAVYTEGSSIYLKEGEKVKLRDLVYGLMLRSGNDSAVAIAEHVGGSVEGFTYLMNEKAAWLGMDNSHFDNPHGLDSDKHYSTAYDMALLTRYAMNNEEFKKITGTTSYKPETKNAIWHNKNKLLTHYYDYATGGKTGYTRAAGRTLVSTAEKDGMSLIAVTLNDPNDWKDHMRLFNWAFEEYDLKTLQDKGAETYQVANDQSIYNGYIREDLIYPLTNAEQKQLYMETYIESSDEETGIDQRIGKKIFMLEGKNIAETPIYSANQTEEPNFMQRFLNIVNQIFGVV